MISLKNIFSKLLGKKEENSIDIIAEKGNVLFDNNNFEQAIETWKEGLELIPKPLNLHEEAVWFQTAIADAFFMLEKYEEAYDYIFAAKSNLSGSGYVNPFVMLRLGQCSFELGKPDAKEYLLRAYFLAGKEIFIDGEKYFDIIRNDVNETE